MATTYTTDCEACGAAGAQLVITPNGGLAEMCEECLDIEERQALLDAECALR
ncbi:hypothetical protein [Micromonospora sp. NPDC023956]|uniref:hypothetical protein n=1 Tax=Micromonospora sp. NPDC023956 TaxID=3155722 RepID=UPI0033D3874E